MLKTDHTEQVYAFIWRYVTTKEALPFQDQIADALDISREEVSGCVYILRRQGRISPTTLLPIAYDTWWRETVRREQRWSFKPLIPLRRMQEKQLPLNLPDA